MWEKWVRWAKNKSPTSERMPRVHSPLRGSLACTETESTVCDLLERGLSAVAASVR